MRTNAKRKRYSGVYVCIFFMLLSGYVETIWAQPGNTVDSPIEVGTFYSSFRYSDTRNTLIYTDNYWWGYSTNDVFYKFTITQQMEITVHNCGSKIIEAFFWLHNNVPSYYTEMPIADVIDFYEGCPCESYAHFKIILNPGTYILVVEANDENGSITTNIIGEILKEVPSIEYSYDASGNQIKKELIQVSGMISGRSLKSSKEEIPEWDLTDAVFNEPAPSAEEMMNELKLKIYPNPTRGDLRVDITGGEIPRRSMFLLYDITGKVLKQQINISATNFLDISSYPAGTYILRVILDNDVSVWKIIKE